MGEEIFRKKSLDKIKSPDNLDDYIQVSNPGVWLLLVCVIALLTGACIWSVFGHIDSTVETSINVEDSKITCNISDEESLSIQEGMIVKCDNFKATITAIEHQMDKGYVCVLQSDQALPDGIYKGKIIIRSFNPITFVLNRGN